jgi:hypothetical protein
MEENLLTKGGIAEDFTGIGTVTREIVLKRAQKLALINNNHSSNHVSVSEFEQAKREPTGGAGYHP